MNNQNIIYIWKGIDTFKKELKYNEIINKFISKAYNIYLSNNQFYEICFVFKNENHTINFTNMTITINNSIFKYKLEIIGQIDRGNTILPTLPILPIVPNDQNINYRNNTNSLSGELFGIPFKFSFGI